jgi:phage tail-like protein
VPQPRINVDVDLGIPGLPGMPSVPTPGRPNPAGAASAARGAARPGGAGANGGIALNRATNGRGAVASLPARPDPVGELRFKVQLPGVEIGRFRECTGLAAEMEVKDYNEGGVNDRVHKLPTRLKYPNLVLKRGVTYEDALLQWLWKTQQRVEPVQRVNVTVSLMGPNGQPVREWVFQEAFPIKWTGPNLNAGSNQIATEALEIVHAGLQMQAGG